MTERDQGTGFAPELAERILGVASKIQRLQVIASIPSDYDQVAGEIAEMMSEMRSAQMVDEIYFVAAVPFEVPRKIRFQVIAHGIQEERVEFGEKEHFLVGGRIQDIVRGDESLGQDSNEFYLMIGRKFDNERRAYQVPLSTIGAIEIQSREFALVASA